MRRFGENIVIDGASLAENGDRYERDVEQQLVQLMLFETGRVVVGELWGRRPRTVRVVPWRSVEHNADAAAVSRRDAFAAGMPIRNAGDGRVIRGAGVGTGRGSDSVVHYTPDTFGEDRGGWSGEARAAWVLLTGAEPPGPGDDRGEVLLHELVHALQELTGTMTNAPTPAAAALDTVSEFNAIVVANVYSSERGRLLRAHHHGQVPATNPDAFRFHPMLASRLHELRKRLPGLAGRLGLIDTPFNPFRPGAVTWPAVTSSALPTDAPFRLIPRW